MSERNTAVYHLLKTFPNEALQGDSVESQTPARVSKMWDELLKGYSDDPATILSKTFAIQGDSEGGIVTVQDIPFYSCCEHHLVPFFGKVSIAYIPRDRVVGLSKFARLTECYARRLQVQERMGRQILADIEQYLHPLGAMVIIEAEHMCMQMRGVEKPGTKTVTSNVSGVFRDKPEARAEALSLLLGGK